MAEAYKNRRTGLVAFGAVQILLGCATLALLFRLVAAETANAPQGLFLYCAGAIYFIVTGIGSIRGRRWARALIAAVSGAWAACGVLVLGGALPAIGVEALYLIVLPLVLTIFYSSRDTALTADALDPRPRWTDRAPVPVIAVCAVLAFAAAEALILSAQQPFVVFGRVLTGALAALAYIALALLFAQIAAQLFRLRQSAWWVLVLLHVIGGATWAATLPLRFTSAGAMVAVCWIAYLAFLIWLRRRYLMFSA